MSVFGGKGEEKGGIRSQVVREGVNCVVFIEYFVYSGYLLLKRQFSYGGGTVLAGIGADFVCLSRLERG